MQTSLPKPAVNASAGIVAAVAATLITQPADMVRTQMQLGLVRADNLGTVGTLRALLRDVGPRVLLAGVLPRVRPPQESSPSIPLRLFFLFLPSVYLSSLHPPSGVHFWRLGRWSAFFSILARAS